MNRDLTHPYHAHIYFTLEEQALASKVRTSIALAIPELTYLGRLIPMPIGPHPKPMFEVHIPVNTAESAIKKIDALREGFSVLIHPVQQDELDAHTDKAQWLGDPLTLNLQIFKNH